MKKIFFYLFFILVTFPYKVLAVIDLVPCGTTRNPDFCEFSDLYLLFDNVIEFLLFTLAVPVTALMIIYGGMTMIIYASNPAKRSEGVNIIKLALWGILISLGAYVIVKFMLMLLTGNTDLLIEELSYFNQLSNYKYI